MKIRKKLALMMCLLLIITTLNIGSDSGKAIVNAESSGLSSLENEGSEVAVHSETDAAKEEYQEDLEEISDEESSDEASSEEPSEMTEVTDVTTEGEASEEIATEEADEEDAAFSDSKIVDGVIITVEADEGVFPEGATLLASKVSDSEEAAVSKAVDEVKQDNDNISSSYTFDIKIIDKNGNEIEPDTSKGSVKVSFAMSEVANENLETNVWHIEGDVSSLSAEKLETSESGEIVTAETTGFSYYQVEFTYGEKQYVLPGDESVALTEILAYVGITNRDGSVATDESITTAAGSDDSLFTVEKENGIWIATAVTAFSSNEKLVVTVDGVEYEILVTDAAYDDILNSTTVVHFDEKDWYLIDYDENESTVTLLSKECVGASKFNDGDRGRTYSGSMVETYVNDWYENKISTEAKTAVNGENAFLLTTAQAKGITNGDVRKCSNASNDPVNCWWLCSPGTYDDQCVVAVKGDDGNVNEKGYGYGRTFGVRPALKLNLEAVIFSSDDNSFYLPADVDGVSLNKNSTAITVGSSETLTANVTPANAKKTVTWSSSDTNVATVDENGNVTGVSVGIATITATATNGTTDTTDDKEATCTVTVTKGVGSISYTTNSLDKTYGDAAFTNTLTKTGDGTVTYTSSNEDVATVDATTGQVTITGAGTATITANVEDSANYDYATKTATYTLNVSEATMTVSANNYDAAYDGDEHGISINVTKPTSGYTIKYGTTEGTYDLDVCPTITDVNDSPLTIYYKITAPNYNDITGSKTVTITKAGAATSTAPTAKSDLTYTGEDQDLINEGLTDDGSLQYSLDGQMYSPRIPKGKNIGTYTVYYKVIGDENHNDSTPRTITVSIGPVDKTALETLIAEATDYYDIIRTNDDYTDIVAELDDAIDEAQYVDDDDNITGQQVRDAIDDLQDALDKAKADVVSVIINKLPSPNDVTTEHKDEIEAAREAFDDLTDDQKAKVPADTKKKLEDDEAALLNKTKEAAKEKLKEKYDGLVESGDYDEEGLEELKNAYDDAVAAIEAATVTDTEDAPKNNGPWKEEKSGERALDAVKTAVAKITEIINNLPDPDDVTKEHKDDIKNARKVYDGLTDRQKRQVPDDLKNKLENDEIALVIALIDNLPEPEDVTTDDKDDIEDARKAYDSLTPEQQRQIPDDTKTKLEDDEAALLERVKEAAKEELKKKYDELAGSGDYDEDGLKELKDAYEEAVDAIDNATVPDSKDKPKKNGPWNKEKSGEDALDAVKTAADKVIDAINNLPDSDDVTADDREVIEAARKAYDELTDEQKAQVNPKALKKLIDDENALKTAKIIYSAIEGDGSNWEKGDTNGDKFVFKRNVNDYKTFEEFTGILVDGDKVDSSNYTAEAGSVIIILKPEYLETLSVGKHTLTAQFTDAEDVTVVFEVLAKGASNAETAVTAPDKNANNHIDTGDKMNIKLMVMLMISSCLAAYYITLRWRKIR